MTIAWVGDLTPHLQGEFMLPLGSPDRGEILPYLGRRTDSLYLLAVGLGSKPRAPSKSCSIGRKFPRHREPHGPGPPTVQQKPEGVVVRSQLQASDDTQRSSLAARISLLPRGACRELWASVLAVLERWAAWPRAGKKSRGRGCFPLKGPVTGWRSHCLLLPRLQSFFRRIIGGSHQSYEISETGITASGEGRTCLRHSACDVRCV